jgi:hypothetical protein
MAIRAQSSVAAGGMKTLAEQIRCELELKTQTMGHCAIYEDELQRKWPLDEKDREKKIAQFARNYGFHLSFYRRGLCAIFVKESREIRRRQTRLDSSRAHRRR